MPSSQTMASANLPLRSWSIMPTVWDCGKHDRGRRVAQLPHFATARASRSSSVRAAGSRNVVVVAMTLAKIGARSQRSPAVPSASLVSAPRTAAGSAMLANHAFAAADRSARDVGGNNRSGRQSSTSRATRYVPSTISRAPPRGARPASDASARNRNAGNESAYGAAATAKEPCVAFTRAI